VNTSHAKLLLQNNPDALIDPAHGAFGVSPLDRMASGYFIHGDPIEWAEKLRLALKVAAYIRTTKNEGAETTVLPDGFFRQASSPETFFPYHELIRLITSDAFRGHKFGNSGWLNTLEACTSSDTNAFVRPDNLGNLPLHAALGSECNTMLGLKNERRLIKYLLSLDKNMALCLEGGSNEQKRMPLRMSIENGWPVYDLIIDAALSRTSLRRYSNLDVEDRSTPLLHDALMGPCHQRFGVHGSRQLIKKIIAKMIQMQQQLDRSESAKFNLLQPVDSDGRTALHVAVQYKWPVYDLIIKAFPTCLEHQDPPSRLFPFQTLAVAMKGQDETQPLETSMLYELIRVNPLCIQVD